MTSKFLISNFRHVLNAVCFLLGNYPASEVYMLTFQITLSHLYRQLGVKNDWGWECWGIYTEKGLARK